MNKKKTKRTSALLWAAAISAGALALGAGPASAQDGILLKVRAGETNYCHLKFPAIRPDTLSWDRPVLQSPSTGDIVDFYGPCDYDPIGEDAVAQQRRLQHRPGGRYYSE